jgi:hypothetical protein
MPELAAIEATSETVDCFADFDVTAHTLPTVLDACGNELTPSAPVESTVPDCEGDVTYTWTYTDCAGSTQDYVHTVTIDMPELATIEATSETVDCFADFDVTAHTLPTVYDACGTELTPSAPVESTVPDCEGDVTYTWTYTDCAGSTQDYVHTVTIDMPELATIEATSETVDCFADFDVTAHTLPTVYDACGNELTPSAPVESTVPDCEGDVTYTWTYTDCAGSTQDYVHTVTIDMPELATIEATSETVDCFADFDVTAHTLPTVLDACGTELTPSAPVESTVPDCEGDVTYTWTYTDCAGSTQDYVHTVTIDMPELAAIEATSETVDCFADFDVTAHTLPTVLDACGNELTPSAPVESAVPDCEGDVTYTWTYTDCAGSTQDYIHTVTIDMPELAAILKLQAKLLIASLTSMLLLIHCQLF